MAKMNLVSEAGFYHEESLAGKWCSLCLDPWPCLTIRLAIENARLRNRLLEHACSCVGTEAAESGYGLESGRHEKLCGYRVALHTEEAGGG
jgi:hypothetical protein